MGKIDKLLRELVNKKISPRNYYKLLKLLGYRESKRGKTSGSLVVYKSDSLPQLVLHRAHAGRDLMHIYECNTLIAILEEAGIL